MGDVPQGISDDPLKFDAAIEALRKKVAITDAEWAALEEAERQYAFKVANVAQIDVIADVFEAIQRAIDDGTTLDQFAADIGPALENAWGAQDAARIENVFRTNVMGAYNAGRHEEQQAVSDTRPYWRADVVLDDRTSDDICDPIGRANVVLPVDHPWWQTHYPPLHYNCRTVVTSLTAEQAQREGISSNGPNVRALPGFGTPPAGSGGGDWEPEIRDYPPALRGALKDALDETG